MERFDIISKVTEPTDWVNSLVTVEKADGSLRVCLDPKDLNNAIKRPHYPMKTIEDVLPDLANAKYFSKLDARSGYWAMKLEYQSSYLTTFNSPFGRYRFLRVPFGIKSARDEFQRKIDKSFEGLTGVAAIVDDILVHGRDKKEHNRNLKILLERCRERGIKLNPDKLEVCMTQVSYFGHVLSSDGLRPDPSKISAIRDMEPPANRSELETLLGMITYLANFSPNLSEITSSMRSLLSKDVIFSWDEPQKAAFEKAKAILTHLGCCVLQDDRPVAYASKTLTKCEVNYAQIEKELYAVLFGVKRHHHYVYGKHIHVQTDHKPLVTIVKKPLHTSPPRLQQMLVQLQNYDIDLYYVPGKDIPLADTLSRKSIPDSQRYTAEGLDAHIHTVISNIPVGDQKTEMIRQATEADAQFRVLKNVILEGWPYILKECPKQIVDFWNHRDELTIIDGIILKGNRIVIPQSCRSLMLDKLHSNHMGVEKCLRRARDTVFWPNLSADLKKLVLSCTICLERRNANTKEDMAPSPLPDRPWQVLASDLFSWENDDYIVLVDYFSNFFEVSRLSNAKAEIVIRKLKCLMSRHGIPEKQVSDNGPAYACQEFSDFAREWDFIHVTSSPLYAQSNGFAEKTVQTSKNLLSKAKANGRDPYLAILDYRNTPLACGQSPAQLLMSRRLRSTLTTSGKQLSPRQTSRSFRQKRLEYKNKQKTYYDRLSKPLKPLDVGEAVRIYKNKLWKPAVVTKKVNPRSYIVRTEDGELTEGIGGIYLKRVRHPPRYIRTYM